MTQWHVWKEWISTETHGTRKNELVQQYSFDIIAYYSAFIKCCTDGATFCYYEFWMNRAKWAKCGKTKYIFTRWFETWNDSNKTFSLDRIKNLLFFFCFWSENAMDTYNFISNQHDYKGKTIKLKDKRDDMAVIYQWISVYFILEKFWWCDMWLILVWLLVNFESFHSEICRFMSALSFFVALFLPSFSFVLYLSSIQNLAHFYDKAKFCCF